MPDFVCIKMNENDWRGQKFIFEITDIPAGRQRDAVAQPQLIFI